MRIQQIIYCTNFSVFQTLLHSLNAYELADLLALAFLYAPTGVRAYMCSNRTVPKQLLYYFTTCVGDGIVYVCTRVHVVYLQGFLESAFLF